MARYDSDHQMRFGFRDNPDTLRRGTGGRGYRGGSTRRYGADLYWGHPGGMSRRYDRGFRAGGRYGADYGGYQGGFRQGRGPARGRGYDRF